LVEGNIERFEEQFNKVLIGVSSFHDFVEKEKSYHNLMIGALLYMLGIYHVRSNRVAGRGRYDIAMIPTEMFKDKNRPVILEFKVAKEPLKEKEYSEEELLALANDALLQIKDKSYIAEYEDKYQKDDFLLVGIGAQGKRCRVVIYNYKNPTLHAG